MKNIQNSLDTLRIDSIKPQPDSLAQQTATTMPHTDTTPQESSNIWAWVALGECAIILVLLGLLLKKRKPLTAQEEIIRKAKEGVVDYDDIISSSFHAKKLHDKLIRICHPDRFPQDLEPEKHAWASRISQEVRDSKTSLKRLQALQQEIEQTLHITIS